MAHAGDNRPMLEGIKVVDLTSVVFGPYCTQMLADLGAEVTKIEAPGIGDAYRWAGKPAASKGMGPGFFAINRGKRSLALDLKQDGDRARMLDLLREADLFVVNVRGKALERLGLDYESLTAINPELIYIHCIGFGQDGPYADLQAYDDVIQAASGAASLLPRVDGEPRARYLPSLIADKVAGLHAAHAALAAIVHKLRTGRGQHVEVPMFEAFTGFILLEHLGGLTYDPPNALAGYERQIDPDRQPFPTSDGYISIVPYTDASWPKVFAVLGAPEVLDDERFADPASRFANIGALYREMAGLTASFTTQELLEKCHAAQLPAQAVRNLDDMLDDPHLAATGFFRKRTHPTEGGYREMRPPFAFGDYDMPELAPPPLLGEANSEEPGP
ncbi:CoA transferase [Qipengyuania sp. XHP0211]|uniref:CaiB/BaiF CoA transferase family protein n=1 Tax=Qipengyuania sp. XHP0211 TaxID=3038079 RepID=UPI00241EAE9A|nr:CoA transferase [Qipengyuania sp. XHP0211]MDG5750628.1 CoA transferase [Qipengyuania sp. XHP0211]